MVYTIRYNVARGKRHLRVRNPSADADGPLVDVQERTDAVAGAVAVIEPELLVHINVSMTPPSFESKLTYP